jgi:hypothetical protein
MTDEVRRLADAVLYEGHVLWPYRRSSIKNRQRWTFGGVYPRAYAEERSDRFVVQAECLLEGQSPEVDVDVRFLHTLHRQAAAGDARRPVDELDGYLTWDETTERTVRLSGIRPGQARSGAVAVAAGETIELLRDGALVRTWEALDGRLEARLDRLGAGLHRARVVLRNTSTWPTVERDGAIRRSMLSAHAVLRVRSGAFVSATDPPEDLRAATAGLRNDGLWPVLVGEEGARETMLASPIILSDYARVAPESPGDFFDGGEIDQLLVLNILGLTDDEKRELRAGDPRAREVLERTEAMTPEELLRLSGTFRDLRPAAGT